jgi:hypothetical protein
MCSKDSSRGNYVISFFCLHLILHACVKHSRGILKIFETKHGLTGAPNPSAIGKTEDG